MLANTIACLIAALCAAPAEGRQPVDNRPRTGPVISESFRRDLAAASGRTFVVWVFLTDKGIDSAAAYDAAIAVRKAELSDRTLRRRALRRSAPGLLDQRDFALFPEYVTAVTATGASLRRQIRWLNAVSVKATPDQIRALARLPFVRRVKRLARAAFRPPLPEGPAGTGGSPRGDPAWYGASYNQLNQINVVAAHDAGYTGAGIIVGILDTGFIRTHDAFNQTTPSPVHPVQIIGEYDFINNDNNAGPEPGDPPDQHNHGTYILGTLGAYYPTVIVGGAFNAAFLLAKTEDTTGEYPGEEDNYVAGLQWIEANGADMATSSLGYIDWYSPQDLDGQTAVTTIAVNIATANGLVCCTAVGNAGHDNDPATLSLIAPADAFQVFACGAVWENGDIAGFSSDGPSFDGRVKPEVLARGVYTSTVSPFNDTDLSEVHGTSLSTPLVAGAMALMLQAHPDWSVDMIRRAVMHTAADFLANATYDPLYIRGNGIIDIMAAISFVHSDVNGDGSADGGDVEPFVQALLGANTDPDETRRADINADGLVALDDVPVFVSDLLRE